MSKVPLRCPACDSAMQVTQLHCPVCDTQVQGHFTVSPILHLTAQQLHFVEVFLKCRGNIREVERELGISYPTVRARLDEVIQHLGYHPSKPEESSTGLDAIVQFEHGELSFEETLEKLRKG
ncbi:DUF2089 domain-containing protein [Alicyclobacillus acidoterrestris]|uniref:DUF2089 domain-containing protein n=1 Tax=Alicyclobacillus acidoterrestris (strain ATCC 49025 / DSM 3922 / CIP 106132 / NCIMB 13137 / GD3B) TaxID=1356854 RepID=T0BP20_ALIAG|nr:DUF2089 domain-containing protein [Alicyclobacillus acidoterrestris]EPZ42285.1 hypothetical protein N007_15405 [Alicyclobacillus acidoterrestris ATCC 49025]UNO48117.1 DUF2089 domain-containing protein [Alicyclobacillus acidoterrestris]